MFKFRFQKEVKGQTFEGLDLLTKLLTPISKESGKNPARPLIEEVSSAENLKDNETDEDDEEELEWFVEQNLNQNEQLASDLTKTSPKYGFANMKSNIFSKLSVNIK